MTVKRATLPFHIVDVFAVEPLTGNPLAVADTSRSQGIA
jgi:predicted PhzF superfamily epimerase YddE/YHI9